MNRMEHFVDIVHDIILDVQKRDWNTVDKVSISVTLKTAAFDTLITRHYMTDYHEQLSDAPLFLKIWANHFLSELDVFFSISDRDYFDDVWDQFTILESIKELCLMFPPH